jgi:Fuc2NAc and GlcNAc transferase
MSEQDGRLVAWLICGLAFPLSCWMTGRVRRMALDQGVLDRPGPRSSHTRPTPRGGGLAFVSVLLIALALAAGLGLQPWRPALVLGGGGAVVAGVGWRDDQRSLLPGRRLLAHLLVAAAAVAGLEGVAPLSLGPLAFGNGLLVQAAAVLFLAWMINLFNFMDGIDGLAAVEAISVAGVGSAALLLAGGGTLLQAWGPLSLASAVAGFLVWNWPPARIFMGDAGSGFLGFAIGVFMLQAGRVSSDLFWSWMILAAVFLVDATATLLVRLARGESWWLAHRSHAYQRLALRLGRHLPVSLGILAINLLWLTPWALLLSSGLLPAGVALPLAFAPLLALAVALGAGRNPPGH